MEVRYAIGTVFWAALVVHLAAAGAPSTNTLSSSEHPVPNGTAPHPATYGLCTGPQNAEDFPSHPVPVVETSCDFTQELHSTSPTASYGGTCGGYTVAFGPKGDLKRKWRYLWLTAGWGDAPLTATNCASAHIAAVAWGYLCTNAACTTGAWEQIGGPPRTTHGTWNTASSVCYIGIGANTGQKDYQTVNMDVIATLGQGRSAVKKRASVAVHNQQPNGRCPTATYTPH